MHLAEHISTSIIDVCLLKAHGYRTLLFFFGSSLNYGG
ncbi:hypothetical protein ASZ90_013683 [hydrocarbon metagenome]|uniref:Uncharacterized protein n=1 Tax=hydrocarbon metagenome TaxID=938273 RepID=A0A0W8F7P1_9ZZZZ